MFAAHTTLLQVESLKKEEDGTITAQISKVGGSLLPSVSKLNTVLFATGRTPNSHIGLEKTV